MGQNNQFWKEPIQDLQSESGTQIQPEYIRHMGSFDPSVYIHSHSSFTATSQFFQHAPWLASPADESISKAACRDTLLVAEWRQQCLAACRVPTLPDNQLSDQSAPRRRRWWWSGGGGFRHLPDHRSAVSDTSVQKRKHISAEIVCLPLCCPPPLFRGDVCDGLKQAKAGYAERWRFPPCTVMREHRGKMPHMCSELVQSSIIIGCSYLIC